MATEREAREHHYFHHQLEAGKPVRFAAHQIDLTTGGWFSQEVQDAVVDIRGGGFYGKVLLFDDYVIKTTQPDPWHELWRQVNWNEPFPPQTYQAAATAEYLATSIIHRLVPKVVGDDVYTPKPLGYTRLGTLGYAQLIERMHGHIPDLNLQDTQRIGQVRERIWNAGVQVGIEHAAQVHPDNPFGKPNLWLDDQGKIIWLDTLPAMRHTGFVKPFFHFPFHRNVRESFGAQDPTFNRLHTRTTREYLTTHPDLFEDRELGQLRFLLDAYDVFHNRYLRHKSEESDQFRRKVSQEERQRIARAARESAQDFVTSLPIVRLGFDQEARQNALRFVTDGDYRRQSFLETTTLRGLKMAYDHDLISQEQWDQTLDKFTHGELKKYFALQAYYQGVSRANDVLVVAIAGGALGIPDTGVNLALSQAAGLFVPAAVRYFSTHVVDQMTSLELKEAIKVSKWPIAGGYLAIPKQLSAQSQEMWHYTKRWLVASLSKVISPAAGGIGSDMEENLWHKLNAVNW